MSAILTTVEGRCLLGAGAVAGVFLVVQIFLALRVRWRFKSQQRRMRDLSTAWDELRTGGLDPEVTRAVPWLGWVDRHFVREAGAATNSDRDDALDELDWWCENDASYVFLQRMSIMAPLLGLLATAGGFFSLWMSGAGSRQTDDVFSTVVPLIAGVGAGACLALVNQLLLQWVGNAMDAFRAGARRWFDTAVWPRAHPTIEASAGSAAGALDTLADEMRSAAERFDHAAASAVERFGHAAASADESAHSMRASTTTLQSAVESFGGETSRLSHEMQGACNALARATEGLETLGPKHAAVAEGLNACVEDVTQSVGALRGCSQELADAVRDHRQMGKSLQESINQTIPTQTELRKAMQDFAGSAQELSRHVETMQKAAGSTLANVEKFGQATGQAVQKLSPALAALEKAMCGFVPAVEQHRQSLQSLSNTGRQLASFNETLEKGCTVMENAIAQHYQISAQMAPAYDSLEQAIVQMSELTQQLHDAQSRLAPAEGALAGAVNSLGGSAGQLAEFVREALPSASQGFGQLTSTLDRFRRMVQALQGPMQALQGLRRMEEDIHAMADGVARATATVIRLGEAFEEAVQRVRAATDEAIRRRELHARDDGSRSWFGRKRRSP